MSTRENALNNWLKTIFYNTPFKLTLLAGDASFRRYFRLYSNDITQVVMDAPPEKEALLPFINIAKTLANKGIHTPEIHAVDLEQGFMLLEDLGDQLLLPMLTPDNANTLYTEAINTLLQLQQCPTSNPTLPIFNKAFMLKEMSLCRDWFIEAYLEQTLNLNEEQLLNNTLNWIALQLAEQPQVFIHRDYHSRNLILVDKHDNLDIGVIDFQDAMRGPITYDLVSLLKDCYIQWPRDQIINWLTYFYQQGAIKHHYSMSEFTRAFDLCGLQRHLKVLGIFCRLSLRDNKPGYLRDVPRTLNYVMETLGAYSELQSFHHFMQQTISPLFMKKALS
jgi:aminoglycoside/choline kinase family phosphotransferase